MKTLSRLLSLCLCGYLLSACSLDIKGDFRTRDGQPLEVRNSKKQMVKIPPGELKVFMENGSPIFKGAIEIKNSEGKKITEIETPRASKPGTMEFKYSGYEIGQRFDLMGHVRKLPDREKIYQKNDHACTYCGLCMDPDHIDKDYKPTFKERLDNGFKKFEKKDPKVTQNCKCSGTQKAILKDMTTSTQSSLYFIDGQNLIARFRAEPVELTLTTKIKEITKCDDYSKGIDAKDVIEAVVPVVVNAITE